MRRLFEAPAPRLVEFSWNHGRFLDFWSVVHVLTGVLLGLVMWALALPFARGALVIAGLATLYEVFEIWLQISEDAENVLSDIIVTTLGGTLAWHFAQASALGFTKGLWAFAVLGIADLFLFSLGWRHYLKKKLYGKDN